MNINHRNMRVFTVLLSISVILSFGSVFPKPAAMSCEMAAQSTCCSAKVDDTCAHAPCCRTSSPTQSPLPVDQLKAGSGESKHVTAAIGSAHADAGEVTPRHHGISVSMLQATQSLIVQHVRLQI